MSTESTFPAYEISDGKAIRVEYRGHSYLRPIMPKLLPIFDLPNDRLLPRTRRALARKIFNNRGRRKSRRVCAYEPIIQPLPMMSSAERMIGHALTNGQTRVILYVHESERVTSAMCAAVDTALRGVS